MRSVLEEIIKLRNGKPATVDKSNSNRYRLLLSEADGSKTAYYFSAPIYHAKNGKLLYPEFSEKDGYALLSGTYCSTIIGETVELSNENGSCLLRMPGEITNITPEKIQKGNVAVVPTLCGVAFRADCKEGFSFELETSDTSFPARANNKCFCLMQEKFRPFVTVSCVGTLDENENVIAPCRVICQKKQSGIYHITILPESYGKKVFFEVNLYESKLLQDTTVSSLDAYSNNAFGSVAYLGETSLFGEEWLYVRPDLGKMPELRTAKIESAIIHIPRLSSTALPLRAHGITARFCSFGTNWSNKILSSPEYAESVVKEGYVDIPATSFFADGGTGFLKVTNGWILKPTRKNSGFAALSTADSSFAPQILEVKFT